MVYWVLGQGRLFWHTKGKFRNSRQSWQTVGQLILILKLRLAICLSATVILYFKLSLFYIFCMFHNSISYQCRIVECYPIFHSFATTTWPFTLLTELSWPNTVSLLTYTFYAAILKQCWSTTDESIKIGRRFRALAANTDLVDGTRECWP